MEKFFTSILAPLKFIIEQPLYISLNQLNLVQVGGITVSFYLLFDLINFYKLNYSTLNSDNTNTIFAFCTAIFATIWVSLNSIKKP